MIYELYWNTPLLGSPHQCRVHGTPSTSARLALPWVTYWRRPPSCASRAAGYSRAIAGPVATSLGARRKNDKVLSRRRQHWQYMQRPLHFQGQEREDNPSHIAQETSEKLPTNCHQPTSRAYPQHSDCLSTLVFFSSQQAIRKKNPPMSESTHRHAELSLNMASLMLFRK